MRKAMNIICGILAELCALAVIFLGAYLAYDAKASPTSATGRNR